VRSPSRPHADGAPRSLTRSERKAVRGLPIGNPIVDQLPGIYQDGMFIRQFTAGLDEVLAPTVTTLDSLHAYVDPDLAPPDFVGWLGGWVGVTLQEDWPIDRRRAFVAAAADLYARRGTAHGVRDEVAIYSGGAVQVSDPGGVYTSRTPTTAKARGNRRKSDRTVQVTVDVSAGVGVNWAGLQELIRDAVPAHLPVEIELREKDGES
jgi:phage tail-like protein